MRIRNSSRYTTLHRSNSTSKPLPVQSRPPHHRPLTLPRLHANHPSLHPAHFVNPDGSKPKTQLAYDARANELFFVGDLAAYNKQFDYYPAGAVVSSACGSFAQRKSTHRCANQPPLTVHPLTRTSTSSTKRTISDGGAFASVK